MTPVAGVPAWRIPSMPWRVRTALLSVRSQAGRNAIVVNPPPRKNRYEATVTPVSATVVERRKAEPNNTPTEAALLHPVPGPALVKRKP